MAHRCQSSQYSNMRPRYVLGRTVPEATGVAGAAVLGYLVFKLTHALPYRGQVGMLHLLLIFAMVALPLVIGFVFFMDGAEPYPRQVAGYLRRRTVSAVTQVPSQIRAGVSRAVLAVSWVPRPALPTRLSPGLLPSEAPTDGATGGTVVCACQGCPGASAKEIS